VKRIYLSPSIWFVVFLILVGGIFFVSALTVEPLQARLLGLITRPLLVVLGVMELIKELREGEGKEARA
jgi:fumarate reductase subunit C